MSRASALFSTALPLLLCVFVLTKLATFLYEFGVFEHPERIFGAGLVLAGGFAFRYAVGRAWKACLALRR